MTYRMLLLGVLLVSSLAKANVESKPVSALIDSYVKIQLDFYTLKKACGDYDYKIYEVKTQRFSDGVTVIDWMIVDRIGTKFDQRFFTFQTTNLDVSSMFQSLGKSDDWQANIAQCKNT